MAIRLTSDLFQPQRTLLSQFSDINYDESFEVSSYATAAEFHESNNLPEHMNCRQITNIPASSDSSDTVVHTPKVTLRFRELLNSLVKAIDDVEIHIDAPKWRFAGDIMQLGSIIEELWGLIPQVDKSAKEGNWLPLFTRRVFPLVSSDFKNSDMLLLLVAYWLSCIGPELSIPSEEYYLFVTEVYPIFIRMVKKESSIAKIVLLHLYAKMKITSELVATIINCRTRDHEFYAEDSVPMRCTRIIWINILLYRLSNFEVFSGSWTLIEHLQQELDRIIKEEPNATVSSEFFRYPGRHGDTYEETKCIYKLIAVAEGIPSALRDDVARSIEAAKEDCKLVEGVKFQRIKRFDYRLSRHRSLQRKISSIKVKYYSMKWRLRTFKI